MLEENHMAVKIAIRPSFSLIFQSTALGYDFAIGMKLWMNTIPSSRCIFPVNLTFLREPT